MSGVDASTFSITGESYATIALPEADTHTAKTLQEDDVSLGAWWQPAPLPWVSASYARAPPSLRSVRVRPQVREFFAIHALLAFQTLRNVN